MNEQVETTPETDISKYHTCTDLCSGDTHFAESSDRYQPLHQWAWTDKSKLLLVCCRCGIESLNPYSKGTCGAVVSKKDQTTVEERENR